MRGLVVGLGSIGRRHARNWAKLGLGELCICRQAGAPQPEPLGVEARTFNDLEHALAWQPDVVIVCNPTSLHVETACLAVRAGANVLIEKPLGHAMSGVEDLLRNAHARRVHVGVGYNLRFHPLLARLRELVRAGGVGVPFSARAEAGEYLPDWHPWEDHRASYSGRRDLGGGAVLTFSHELDALCWVLGRPVELTALTARAASLDIDAEAVAEITLRMASGALATVHVDYVRRAPRRTLEVIGDEGVLRWEYDANQLWRYAPATREWRLEQGRPAFARNDMYLAELAHFIDVTRGAPYAALADGEQGAAVLGLSLSALESDRARRTIDVREMPWLSSLDRP
jgi:predicted dehydrogenase